MVLLQIALMINYDDSKQVLIQILVLFTASVQLSNLLNTINDQRKIWELIGIIIIISVKTPSLPQQDEYVLQDRLAALKLHFDDAHGCLTLQLQLMTAIKPEWGNEGIII